MFRSLCLTGLSAAILQFAAASGTAQEASGPALTEEDLARDALIRFLQIDRDENRIIDADEFAAQAVVQAGLSRLNGAVRFEGGEDIEVPLPVSGRANRIAVLEDAALEFASLTDTFGTLTPDTWLSVHLHAFAAHDADQDGVLEEHELQQLAHARAFYSGAAG